MAIASSTLTRRQSAAQLDIGTITHDAPSKRARSNDSAAQRFFGVAEVLAHLAAHLQCERADLITLSQVSRRIRAAVQPFLVEAISVRASAVGGLVAYLDRNPGLVERVRYLRVWDDVAHHYGNYHDDTRFGPPLTSSSTVERQYPDTAWSDLGRLFDIIASRPNPPPLLELSFGQLDLSKLLEQLQPQPRPRVLERLASLVISGDFGLQRNWEMLLAVTAELRETHVTAGAEAVEDILRLVCDAQDQAGSTAFHSLAYSALTPIHGASQLFTFRPRLWQRVAGRLRRFSITLPELCKDHEDGQRDDDAADLAVLLRAHFASLIHFTLCIKKVDTHFASDPLYGAIRSFLERHQSLEHYHIDLADARDHGESSAGAEQVEYPAWATPTVPNLRACHIELDHLPEDEKLDWARRHADHLQSLSIGWHDPGAEVVEHLAQATPQRLRKLHAEASIVGDFLAAGVELHHVVSELLQLEDLSALQLEEPAPSITCCEFLLRPLTFSAFLKKDPVALLSLENLPNLTELALCFRNGVTDDTARDASANSAQALAQLLADGGTTTSDAARDTPAESAQALMRLLTGIAEQTPKLRSLSIRYRTAAKLPLDDELTALIGEIPPKLEYLSWYVPLDDRIDTYRVLRTDGEQKSRLQRLPGNFRPFVDRKTGIWEDPNDLATSLTLFEHLGDEPRLKCL
ncbi:hypothetical protein OC842_004871 [Tilletia horrida]|uniref:Uncharacterized protein n=1 Tax=Tilletia horrida TaxID=155126 RepID=A0AAN6G8V0_9BASI|nr:hypothetical protein OC842_004871 [Tilletia horrida]